MPDSTREKAEYYVHVTADRTDMVIRKMTLPKDQRARKAALRAYIAVDGGAYEPQDGSADPIFDSEHFNPRVTSCVPVEESPGVCAPADYTAITPAILETSGRFLWLSDWQRSVALGLIEIAETGGLELPPRTMDRLDLFSSPNRLEAFVLGYDFGDDTRARAALLNIATQAVETHAGTREALEEWIKQQLVDGPVAAAG